MGVKSFKSKDDIYYMKYQILLKIDLRALALCGALLGVLTVGGAPAHAQGNTLAQAVIKLLFEHDEWDGHIGTACKELKEIYLDWRKRQFN